jgi:hypothetical protein
LHRISKNLSLINHFLVHHLSHHVRSDSGSIENVTCLGVGTNSF